MSPTIQESGIPYATKTPFKIPFKKSQNFLLLHRILFSLQNSKKNISMTRVGFEPTRAKPMRTHANVFAGKLALEPHAITTRPSCLLIYKRVIKVDDKCGLKEAPLIEMGP